MLLNLATYKILPKNHCYPSRAGSILSCQQNLVSFHDSVINACTGVSENHWNQAIRGRVRFPERWREGLSFSRDPRILKMPRAGDIAEESSSLHKERQPKKGSLKKAVFAFGERTTGVRLPKAKGRAQMIPSWVPHVEHGTTESGVCPDFSCPAPNSFEGWEYSLWAIVYCKYITFIIL